MYLVYPIPAKVLTTPLMRLPQAPVVFQFSVFRFADPDDDGVVDAMMSANRALYQRALDVGGTLYPYASVPLDATAWQAHWAEGWHSLRAAEEAYDPRGILNRGQGLF